MKQSIFTIIENRPLSPKASRMRLQGDVSAITGPGQFADLALDGFFLRRPFSVCDADSNSFTILYERAGQGTEAMTALPVGSKLDVLTGLGNTFDMTEAGDHPLLIAGGSGASPLYWLARMLRAEGKTVTVILGFSSKEEVFYEEEFRALGCDVLVTTEDGSYGIPGFVTDAMDRSYSYYYACGSKLMLREVCRLAKTGGQLSMAQRLGCGFGVCMGCTCRTVSGGKRLCKDGPVLRKEEVLWDD